MNAITTTTPTAAPTEDSLILVLRNSFYPEASESSVRLVLGYCRAAGLDPMKKPVHIVPMWNRNTSRMEDVIMPGIGLYRIEAARTREYVGKSEPEFGPDVKCKLGNVEVTYPSWCRITVQRLIGGTARSYTAREFWIENYATAGKNDSAPNKMWRKRPYGQIAKCTEAQALRMAFPEQTGGTNTDDEMEGKSFEGATLDHAPEPGQVKQVESKPTTNGKTADAKTIDGNADAPPLSFVEKLKLRLDKCKTAAEVDAVEAMASIQNALNTAPDDVVKDIHKALSAARARVPAPKDTETIDGSGQWSDDAGEMDA